MFQRSPLQTRLPPEQGLGQEGQGTAWSSLAPAASVLSPISDPVHRGRSLELSVVLAPSSLLGSGVFVLFCFGFCLFGFVLRGER